MTIATCAAIIGITLWVFTTKAPVLAPVYVRVRK